MEQVEQALLCVRVFEQTQPRLQNGHFFCPTTTRLRQSFDGDEHDDLLIDTTDNGTYV